jgi:succinate dehydrogenase/fumarate reductase cytochrome b subunit
MKKFLSKNLFIPIVIFFLSFNIASADKVDEFIQKLNEHILNPLISLLFVCAFVVFLYGVVEFIWNANNEQERSRGAQHILWGVIGMVVMISAWGILAIVRGTFGI